MSLNSKVVWSEGMFLSSQHFQQQERYFEQLVDGKCIAYGAYGWGVDSFEIDLHLLNLGKISLISGKGTFPDGTPFDFPRVDEPPMVLEVPVNTHGSVVYLCLPVKRPGAVDVTSAGSTQGLARYYNHEQEVRDVSSDSGESVVLDVGKLHFRLMLETDDTSGYVKIGLVRIDEAREDKNVLLDANYIASCLDCKKSPKLNGFLAEVIGLLHHRGEAIAGRLADTNRGGTAEVADYMMLQLINRLEPMAKHLSSMNGLHPVDLFAETIQMVGELSTFVAKNKRSPDFPHYLHEDLQTSFAPVMATLRNSLSSVYEQSAICLGLVEKKYGIRVAEITDRSIIGNALFVLAARANTPDGTLATHLPAQIKIGPVERIRQLVNAAMPGIGLKPLPVAPRQIPYNAGYTYFQLESKSEFWKELVHSGGFAIHVGGDFPGLELEFWAIRQ